MSSHVWLTRSGEAPDGRRLGVKDNFDTARVRTTYGSPVFCDHVPERTAPAVTSLERLGLSVVGKTNMTEFAFGALGGDERLGPVLNPLDPARAPGGSSSGNAAALVRNECDIALGSDSAGSVRIPAAWCGVVGFKPSRGLIPTDGSHPLAPSFDHAGLMTRTVSDCVTAMRAFLPEREPPVVDPDALRIGIAWLEASDPEVWLRVSSAARCFPGARLLDLAHPGDAIHPLFLAEVANTHRQRFLQQPEAYGTPLRRFLERASRVTEAQLRRARRARQQFAIAVDVAFDEVDIVLTPTVGCVAPLAGARPPDVTHHVAPFNAVGLPALAVPCGITDAGLPTSVQVVGRHGDDDLVLSVARLIAEASRCGAPKPAGIRR